VRLAADDGFNLALRVGYNAGMKMPRFSLRTLLIAVLLLAVACAIAPPLYRWLFLPPDLGFDPILESYKTVERVTGWRANQAEFDAAMGFVDHTSTPESKPLNSPPNP
jgi:hypothetical protein